MNTVDLVTWFQQNIDWNKYVTLVDTIGDELDERKLRFDKSDLLERSLELFSNNELVYVNLEGVDHIVNLEKEKSGSKPSRIFKIDDGKILTIRK